MTALKVYNAPNGIPLKSAFEVQVRSADNANVDNASWVTVPTYSVDAASINTLSNNFNKHPISVASFDTNASVTVRARYTLSVVQEAAIRPLSAGVKVSVEDGQFITFTLDQPRDVMLQVNDDKWQALHLLVNPIDESAPAADSEHVWHFGPGLNNGSAYAHVKDGDLYVPSGKTLYLAGGAFLDARIRVMDAKDVTIRGHGFIFEPKEGAILIERSTNVVVERVTSLSAGAFSLTTGEAHNVHVNNYRSFSSAGNGDGIDLFCSSDILVENCFLRNSDDTITIYGHRWDYSGDSKNITVRDCVLLPDIAHAIQIGTHGSPAKPERFSDILISNIDVLDHEENQAWYQGALAINAGDENLIEDVVFEYIHVEKITKGQLINIRVMQNSMWTTAPRRAIHNVTIRNVSLNLDNSVAVYPSQILGYDGTRNVAGIHFENLRIGNRHVHEGMTKPRWFMVSDLVPLFANEHVSGLTFK